MRAAIYARVSTSDQDNSMQVSELETYAKNRGWEVVQVEQDQMSGAKAQRPGLTAILDAARARRIDVVMVWKLDRFSRSVIDLNISLQALRSAGVRFISITQGIDTDQSSPTSKLLQDVLAAVAEFERELIRERTASGVAKYKRDMEAGQARSRSGKNLPPHRPKRIFDRDEVVRLRNQGLSLRTIAQKMGIGEGTVFRCLRERSKTCTDYSETEQRKETGNPGRNAPATT